MSSYIVACACSHYDCIAMTPFTLGLIGLLALPTTTIALQSISSSVCSCGCLHVQPPRLHQNIDIIVLVCVGTWLAGAKIASQSISSYILYGCSCSQPPRSHRNRGPYLPPCVVACAFIHHDCIAITLVIVLLVWLLAISVGTTASQSLSSSSFLHGNLRFHPSRSHRSHSRQLVFLCGSLHFQPPRFHRNRFLHPPPCA